MKEQHPALLTTVYRRSTELVWTFMSKLISEAFRLTPQHVGEGVDLLHCTWLQPLHELETLRP